MVTDPQRDHSTKTSDERIVAAMRESAARLNGIIQSAMDAIITVDERQRHRDLQSGGGGNVRLQLRPTCSGHRWSSSFRRVSERRTATYIDRFGATGVTRRRMGAQSEIVGLRANGEEFPLEASISQLSSGGQEAVQRDPAGHYPAQAGRVGVTGERGTLPAPCGVGARCNLDRARWPNRVREPCLCPTPGRRLSRATPGRIAAAVHPYRFSRGSAGAKAAARRQGSKRALGSRSGSSAWTAKSEMWR